MSKRWLVRNAKRRGCGLPQPAGAVNLPAVSAEGNAAARPARAGSVRPGNPSCTAATSGGRGAAGVWPGGESPSCPQHRQCPRTPAAPSDPAWDTPALRLLPGLLGLLLGRKTGGKPTPQKHQLQLTSSGRPRGQRSLF